MPVLTADGKRILFIHVPKTGGTTVETLMASYGSVTGVSRWRLEGGSNSPQHLHAAPLRQLHGKGEQFDEHDFDYVFATVRDPITRIQSEYAFLRHRLGGRPELQRFGIHPKPAKADEKPKSMPADVFVARVLKAYRKDPYLLDNHIRPQHEFLCFKPEIFRIEDGLDAVRKRLNHITGLSGTFGADGNVGVSERAPDWYLTSRVHPLVESFYAGDYAAWGYVRPSEA